MPGRASLQAEWRGGVWITQARRPRARVAVPGADARDVPATRGFAPEPPTQPDVTAPETGAPRSPARHAGYE